MKDYPEKNTKLNSLHRKKNKMLRDIRNPRKNDFEELKRIENSNKKLIKIKEILDCDKDYQKIKYKNIFYCVGDDIMISRNAKKEPLIGQIVRILPIGGNQRHPYWPTIEVEW